MLQNATPLRKWAPWPPNISHKHVFCTAPATENASLQILFKRPRPPSFSNCCKTHTQRAESIAPATQNRILNSKSAPGPPALTLLTSKCGSRHNGVHFFGIWTSKSVPKLKRSAHFDLEMCFALQRRAPFEHRRFQKCSQCAFCAFWLGNLLRATTTCTFWASQFPKALRTSGVFSVFPWKCASRHRALHFFDAWTSKSAPTMRRFQHFDFQMCFAPQRRAIVHLSSPQMAPHPPL